jgi:hypothetical protein
MMTHDVSRNSIEWVVVIQFRWEWCQNDVSILLQLYSYEKSLR